jgi:2-polyprenyl-3-methyl-5-hydroxy-6-metoxy-1,4-benzoquinol methylase
MALPPLNVDIYACPLCGGSFTYKSAAGEREEAQGALTCGQGHAFPVAGIPRFVADEGYSASFGLQWGQFQKTQLDSATGNTETRDRFFRGTGWPASMRGETILEAGCGSGRFTEVMLGTAARVISFDYSRAADVAHEAFASKGGEVCQASIYDMPYRRNSFDRVFCYGVIQHTPDVKRAFLCLVDMLRPGGYLAVDVYDAWKWIFHSRYRVRWFTKRMDKEKLLKWCRNVVPAYMKIAPPLHPYNQLFVPIKDYRGARPGFTEEQLVEYSILDTFDMLAPEYDQPQTMATMRSWCSQAGLVDVDIQRGGNGLEIRARKPSSA